MAKVEIIWNLCLVPAYLCVTFVFRTEMNNNMARNLLNKYIWLIETIYKAKQISFDEINEKWLNNEMSEGVELPLRTFHKWRIAVEDIFGLVIECKKKGGYHYYIENSEEIKCGNIRNWLINTISVGNLLLGNQQLKERILLEDIPSGQEYLAIIIEAMKEGRTLCLTYQSYWKEKRSTFDVEPYCVKLFKQRWYLVGRSPYYDKILIYAFDRMIDVYITDNSFRMPKSFSPSDFFNEYYGVIVEDKVKSENIRLKVSAGQANYLRSLPLHPSQVEMYEQDGYCIFDLKIRPTLDFIQEVLKHGEDVEILLPEWLRKDMTNKIKRMWDNYQKEDL